MNPILAVYQGILLVVLFALGLFMPWLTRHDLVFGVRLPEDFAAGEAVAAVKRGYRLAYALIGSLIIAGSLMLPAALRPEQAIFVGVFGLIAATLVLFWIYRAKTLRLKAEQHVMDGRRQIAIADTSPAQAGAASWAWFLIPAGTAVANALLALARYDAIPDRVPMHFNFAGQADSWATKSVATVLFMPFMQLVVTAAFMLGYWAIRNAKRQLSAQRPTASARQNAAFRRAWSVFLIVAAVVQVASFSVLNWRLLGLIDLTATQMFVVALGPAAFMLVYAILLSVKLGQAGSRARTLDPESDAADPTAAPRDDDRFWKAGLFYYNPDDPALWVEKRFGVGYTINFAKWQAWLFVALTLAGLIAALLLGHSGPRA